MSDLARAFDHGKAFIAFLTCGDPDLETTAAAVRAAAQNGTDLIELGIPFSDPTAEGPVIQAANLRALQSGVTTDKIFDLVRELRRGVTIPMVFMTYANVVFSYGTERFLSNCRDVGIDGLILPDVPYEEKEEFLPACRKYGVDFVSLIAPTSENRIAMIARGRGLPLYRLVARRHGRAQRDQDRSCFHRLPRAGKHRYSLRHRLWHLHARAGEEDGRPLRRRDRRLRHRQAPCPVRQGRARAHRCVCKRNEGRAAVKTEKRALCFDAEGPFLHKYVLSSRHSMENVSPKTETLLTVSGSRISSIRKQ